METFAPGVKLPDGRTVTPPGWLWILGFALGGCQWAVREAEKPEFRAMVRKDLRDRKIRDLLAVALEHEAEAERLRRQMEELAKEGAQDPAV